jgi:hypothetical protein
LEDYRIVLEEGVQYWWYVSVRRDADRQVSDIVEGGEIERIDSGSVEYSMRACGKDSARRFMTAGIWYDAFACVNELLEASPEDGTLLDLQAELLSGPRGFHYSMPTMPKYNWWP